MIMNFSVPAFSTYRYLYGIQDICQRLLPYPMSMLQCRLYMQLTKKALSILIWYAVITAVKRQRDMDLLEHTCEMKPVYGYCRISEKEARILRDRTEELVYYNPIRDIYVLGVTEMGKISDCERLWGNL